MAEVLVVAFPPIIFIRVCAVPLTNKSMVSWQTLLNTGIQSFNRGVLSVPLVAHGVRENSDHVKIAMLALTFDLLAR